MAEQVTSAAVARMGLAMVFTLTAHYSLAATTLPPWARAAVLLSVGAAPSPPSPSRPSGDRNLVVAVPVS